MTKSRRAVDNAPLRPFLPPPLESLAPPASGAEGEAEHPGEARRHHDQGYRAGFAAGLERGHAEGHRAGFADGLRQAGEAASAEVERSRREGVGALRAGIAELLAGRAEDRAAQERDLRATLAASIALIAPALARRSLGAELEALVGEAMAQRGEAGVSLRAHPETLAALPAGAAGPGLSLRPDPSMRKDTAEASWGRGGLVFSAEALAERLLAILAPPDTRPPPAAVDAPFNETP